MKSINTILLPLLFAALLLSNNSYAQQNSSTKNPQKISSKSTKVNFMVKPFTPSFIQNNGQFDQYDGKNKSTNFISPSYGSQMGNTIALFNKNSIQFVQNKVKKEDEENEGKGKKPEPKEVETFRQTMTFLNANPDAAINSNGMEQQYFTYPDPKIKNGTIKANGFKNIVITNLYTGIDVNYSFKEEGGIEYSFIIHPGADASVIKIQWSGVDDITIDNSGNLQMNSKNGIYTDKAPIAYYAENESPVIASGFIVKNNLVSFSLNTYDHNKTIVIDPFVQNPNFTGINRAYDIEHDATGNIYVYGGQNPYQLQKYTSTGTAIWTYNTSAGGYYGDFTIDAAGNVYVIYGPWGCACVKVNSGGSMVWSVDSLSFGIETYRIYPNPINGLLEIMGMQYDSISEIRPVVFNVDPNTGYYSHFKLYPSSLQSEARCMSVDVDGSAYGLVFSGVNASSIPATNLLWKVNAANTTLASVQDGYALTESEPSNTDSDFSGYNGTAVGPCALFTYDGVTVKKWDKTTLTLQASVVIPGGIAYTTAGLYTDSCGNVFVGGTSSILEYDNNLTLVTSVPTTGQVYGVNAGNSSTEILACGQGFFGSYTFPACNTSTTDSSENVNIVSCTSPVTLHPSSTGTSYLWSNGSTADSLVVTQNNLYWVQVIGATLCSQTLNITDTFNVTITTPPTNNLGANQTLCGNGPVTLDAANPGDTYTWNTGATTETISVTTTGMYHVTVSNGGCTSTDSVTITFVAAPTVNLGPDTTLCEGQTITLNAGNPGMNYLWNTGATTQTITADSTASYSVTVTLGACTGADTINVTILNPPVVNLGPDKTLCLGEYSTLNAGNPGATYLWSDGSTLDTLHVTSSGQYWVLVSAGTCIGSDTINIIFNTSVTVNLGPDVKLCPGQTVTLNAGNPGEVYLWNTGATTQTIVASITGLYSVAVGSGVCTSYDTVSVLIYITPPVPLSNDTFICPGDQIELQAGKNYATYYWVPGNGGTYSMIVYQPGTYFVYVTDTNGCPSEGSILVQNFCQGNLYIPNTFTPNGNMVNDMFNPICESCVAFHMYIFDRWGETLFESTDIAQGWDGTFQGNNVPQGVYIYRIDYQLYDYLQLLKHTVYGNVNLIR